MTLILPNMWSRGLLRRLVTPAAAGRPPLVTVLRRGYVQVRQESEGISSAAFAEAMQRQGVAPDTRVLVQLHMTSRDAVFAKLCSEYFAEDAATFCLMSFHDVQRARECDDDLARFVKGLETIDIKPVVEEILVDNTDLNERKAITKVFKSHQTALMHRAINLNVDTIVRCTIKEERIYTAVRALIRPHIDHVALPTVTTNTHYNQDSELVRVSVVNIMNFTAAAYLKTKFAQNITIENAQHNVFLPTRKAHVERTMQILLKKHPDMTRTLDRFYGRLEMHSHTLQQMTWVALRECATVSVPNHFVALVDRPSIQWKSSPVLAECLVRTIVHWVAGNISIDPILFRRIYSGIKRASPRLTLHPLNLTVENHGHTTIFSSARPITELVLLPDRVATGPLGILFRTTSDVPKGVCVTDLQHFGLENVPPEVLSTLEEQAPEAAAMALPVVYQVDQSGQRTFLDMPTLHPAQMTLPFLRAIDPPPRIDHLLFRHWGCNALRFVKYGEYVSPFATAHKSFFVPGEAIANAPKVAVTPTAERMLNYVKRFQHW